MNILFPLCGNSVRLKSNNVWSPKPLYKDNLLRSINSLRVRGKYIFVIRHSDELQFGLASYIRDHVPYANVVMTNHTDGAAISCLLAFRFIDNENPLLISNCDLDYNWNPNSFFRKVLYNKGDGGALFSRGKSQRTIGADGFVSSVEEGGVFHWKSGRHFVDAAHAVVKRNDRVYSEFTVEQVVNNCINDGARFIHYTV